MGLMTHPEISRKPTEPITTADALVQALQDNPPDIFSSTTFPLIDNRHAKDPNLFTFAAMAEQVNRLLIPAFYRERNLSVRTYRGESFQFGSLYETRTKKILQKTDMRDEEVLAERTRYKLDEKRSLFRKRDTVLRPHETLILKGIDESGQPLRIELTEYTNKRGKVDVYKFVSRTGDAARSVIMVGSPTLDFRTQKRLAIYFKIPT